MVTASLHLNLRCYVTLKGNLNTNIFLILEHLKCMENRENVFLSLVPENENKESHSVKKSGHLDKMRMTQTSDSGLR